ncbi:tRNA pseudouridine(38-40) synthase TruA [Brevundimonas sp. S30B]|uniref:tRNA pseudouridine(38-40) synthase TruA n=1 Tax=unclassified Brevundimonas TaxID=2622653 RepID=UPI00107160D0|nr:MULTISPECIES: tRNA pseudouridine(38-40) synthase TruA [unclassified Brevundimonas]QBX36535.1 tRNA pseudouridine(38-40) synthase TruA [Brevundimonas sp. MF30-B]TFW00835.1 tRNA pseudouridine(38-40) synthase TruA [Brevundimonas sp. S30B]
MPRYRLTIEYDGSGYNGFQAQAGRPTVQGAIEQAVRKFSGQAVRIAAAGRTDTGVHATGQVVHVDLERDWPARTVMNALNAHLIEDEVSVLDAALVDDEWHARFSATGRRYLYRILNRPGRPALDHGRVWHVKKPLDAEAMNRAAQALVGHHDFTTFRDVNCQSASPVKSLDEVAVERVGEEVRLRFAARSFLHRQVRSMTGTLVEVGLGRWGEDAVAEALAARDRARCGPVAPSTGLYLTGVVYGD